MEVSVKAPAKINLTLDIVGRRPDGYHDVAMVMQTVTLYDTVRVSLSDEKADTVTITCDHPDIPCDERNIAAKAARAFVRETGVTPRATAIDIAKVIPAQAGLAGGSTDGAAVVLALNYLYDTKLSMTKMKAICALVGSDVPFTLEGGTQLATDTGTTLKKLPDIPRCHIVIVKPDVSVSTAQAYAECDKRPAKGFCYTDEVVDRLYRRDIRGLSACLYNEFEQVLTLPEINDIKRLMLKSGALGASMTGSGSAVYAIFYSEKKAQNCVNILKEKYNEVFLAAPARVGCEIE